MDLIITIVSALVVLGILIFVHELGHFLVAKRAGVMVRTFSLGFGPAIWKRVWGETQYRISVIPLGGYVRMLGENPKEEVDPAEAHRSFSNKGVGWRLAIVGAGPASNVLFSIAAYFILLLVWGTAAPLSAQVGALAPDMPAAAAGMQAGDTVLSIDGKPVTRWQDMRDIILESGGRAMTFVVDRAGREVSLKVTPQSAEGTNIFGETVTEYRIGASRDAMPFPAVVGDVIAREPAAEAGIQEGDRIISVNGRPVRNWGSFMRMVGENGDRPMNLVLQRNGLRQELVLKPRLETMVEPNGNKRGMVQVGMAPRSEFFTRPVGFFEAIPMALANTYNSGKLIFLTVVKLLERKVDVKNVGGPILIAQAAGKAAKHGLDSLLALAALISVNLAVLNLLPIPALDGGHLFFFLIEAITRRPVPIRVREGAQQVGVALLLFLMAMIFYNDIERIVTGAMG